MIILSFAGGPNAVHERTFEIFPEGMHDGAAVLLKDGEVVAAIEQERLDRLKHSNKRPFDAIRRCLETAGIDIREVDQFAFHSAQSTWNTRLADYALTHFDAQLPLDARVLIRALVHQELGVLMPEDQPVFVGHHLSHAVSAMAMSGFEDSLVLTLDGQGDEIAGLVVDAHGLDFDVLFTLPYANSLGFFYRGIIHYLGYTMFDEYKVMGLAPYGDPGQFEALFKTFYTLEPEGRFTIHSERYRSLLEVTAPRRSQEPVTQVHKDIAAALQQALEEMAFHLLRHYRRQTGHRNLCFAGGVAHNCTLNGKILASGLFDDVFVQPAAHDAGCALGAGLYVHHLMNGRMKKAAKVSRLRHVYWGTDLGTAEAIGAELRPWSLLLDVERSPDICAEAARLLAGGQILGWAQGRSEFGPRALGNRSIIGDPRPAENKDLINAMVKKREAYRPFAPSVLQERVHDFFDLPPGVDELPFMVFTVNVREDKRELLGAVTHVDGSARIQTVSRETNERFWRLIHAFGELTGVPVLLNTSFNNNVEPIVDSVEDAVHCFLTTQLHALAVGDFLVRKKDVPRDAYLQLFPVLPPYVELLQARGFSPEDGGWRSQYAVARTTGGERSVSPRMFELLSAVDGTRTLADLAAAQGLSAEERLAVVEEALELWARRLILLRPEARAQ
ncbi:MAG TPA: carbamoyltransferase C-terminal domain-containing protein [Thermoanaerobaculia bacterium]|nr:carbamoyltransferase C-terminal domain-containing protein [Thermoanaerobaculia bacterium]